jgi:hypothetical protein
MKNSQNDRKNYHRMRSRHGRLGLGFDRYEALWRQMERIENAYRPKAIITHASDKAMRLIGGSYKQLWSVDPGVFYQSPFVPKPFVK